MGFMIREIDAECTFSRALTIDALRRAIPPDAITRVIAQEGVGEARARRLTMTLVVWLVIALTALNALSTLLECGFGACADNPVAYELLRR